MHAHNSWVSSSLHLEPPCGSCGDDCSLLRKSLHTEEIKLSVINVLSLPVSKETHYLSLPVSNVLLTSNEITKIPKPCHDHSYVDSSILHGSVCPLVVSNRSRSPSPSNDDFVLAAMRDKRRADHG